MSDPRVGSELGGYRIEAVIGRGGMGVVYRAEHLRLGRKVALKLLAPELAANDGFRERFESESRLAAAIDHPHIIPLYEAGDAEGLLFLTMRYVDGIDLKGLLERDAPLTAERALSIVDQVAGALDAAHARGLVHRDVKPANVLVHAGAGRGASEHCYLTDFGLTKDTSQNRGLTATGQFVGTISYVAPEQIEGSSQSVATDQYALGCVLYECLTGHPPFERDSELDVMWAHLSDDPPSVTAHRSDLPDAIDAVIAKALSKAPEDRHETCTAMVAAARAALTAPAAADPTVAGRTVVSSTPDRAPAAAGATRLSPAPAAPAAPAGPAAGAAPRAPAPVAEPATGGRRWAGVAVAALAAVVAAAVAGTLIGGGGEDAAPRSSNVAATGGMSLRFPGDWETLRSPPAIAGLQLEDRIALGPRAASGREGLLAGRIASSRGPLLPAQLASSAGGSAKPTPVRIGQAAAFRFAGLRPRGFEGAVTVYLLLTDRGKAAITCFARVPSPRFDARCAEVGGSLELTGARALDIAPNARYAKAVSDLLAGLARDRSAGRRRLGAAKTSVAQGRAASALAASCEAAARRARGLAVPAAARNVNGAIAAALRDLSATYSKIANAARRRNRARYAPQARALRRNDATLRAAVASLAELGYGVKT